MGNNIFKVLFYKNEIYVYKVNFKLFTLIKCISMKNKNIIISALFEIVRFYLLRSECVFLRLFIFICFTINII